jgi:ribonucleotide monophosphatase NagD (HAD superfamily)
MPSPLVFTDLDGTLLDHDTYDWTPARDALDRLTRAGIPVVFTSSKTAAEQWCCGRTSAMSTRSSSRTVRRCTGLTATATRSSDSGPRE